MEWHIAVIKVLTILIDKGLFNRAITTATAATMVLRLGLGLDIGNDFRIKKLRRAAELAQQAAVTAKGSHARTTIRLRKFHIYVRAMVSTTPIAQWTPKILRTVATIYWILLFAARPGEIGGDQLKLEAVHLTTTTSSTGKTSLLSIRQRLFNSKDVASHMNSHVRTGNDRQLGIWSSVSEVTLPTFTDDFPGPPVGDILLEYFSRRKKRTDIPFTTCNIERKEVLLSPLFVGCPNSKRTSYPPEVKAGTLTSAARSMLITAGAIDGKDAPHICYDLRKTVLTNVLHGRPSDLTLAHQLARHSRETFFRSYELDVRPFEADILQRLATTTSAASHPLSTVMLG